MLKMVSKVANMTPPIPETKEAKDFIDKSIRSSSQYASMIRCAVNAEFFA
jgi:hypothetical protein